MTEQLRLFPDNSLNLLDNLQAETTADVEVAVAVYRPFPELFHI